MLPFYLEVSKSILSEVQCGALTHLTNGLANFLNKTAEWEKIFENFSKNQNFLLMYETIFEIFSSGIHLCVDQIQ